MLRQCQKMSGTWGISMIDSEDDNPRENSAKFAAKIGKVRQVVLTVPYNPTQSGEGLLIAEDGSIIYDDAWMHRELLDDEENNGEDEE